MWESKPLRLSHPDLAALESALRRGEPVALDVVGGNPPIPWDELVPLLHDVADSAQRRWLPPAAAPRADIAVTAVIPTHRRRPLGLDALRGQDVRVDVVVLANGPWTEGVRVPWQGHGATRNAGLAHVAHPWTLFTVDDAIPLGAGFVRTLVEALEAGDHDAVVARQVPWPLADPVTRRRLREWTPPEPSAGFLPSLDNVCALYRTAALRADPFDAVPIAEDWLWGRRHRVGYVPQAPVLHSHPREFLSTYRRTRDIHRVRLAAGEAPRVAGWMGLARAFPSTVGADLPGALGELLGQWRAAQGRTISRTQPKP